MTRLALIALVIAHFAVVVINGISVLFIALKAPWYIAFPLNTYMLGAIFGECPLTKLENVLRGRLGFPRIKKFTDHYIYHWRKGNKGFQYRSLDQ